MIALLRSLDLLQYPLLQIVSFYLIELVQAVCGRHCARCLASNTGTTILSAAKVSKGDTKAQEPQATASTSSNVGATHKTAVTPKKTQSRDKESASNSTESKIVPGDAAAAKTTPAPTPAKGSTAEKANTAAGMGARPTEGKAGELKPAGEAQMAVEPEVKTAAIVRELVFVTSEVRG
jgi:hypothetical protein